MHIFVALGTDTGLLQPYYGVYGVYGIISIDKIAKMPFNWIFLSAHEFFLSL